MDMKETAAMIVLINQHDPRVQSNEASDLIWANAMAPFTKAEAWQAVLEHYKASEQYPATPAAIKKRASSIASRREAEQRAIDAGPPQPAKSFADYERRVSSPEFRALFERGRCEGNADRVFSTVLRETGDRSKAFAARDAALNASRVA